MGTNDEQVRRRREEAQALIDKILHGTESGGRVDPAVAENLRKHLARYPGEPDRALMEHVRDQMEAAGQTFKGVLPEDLDGEGPARRGRG